MLILFFSISSVLDSVYCMECLIELSLSLYWVSYCSECESFLESCAIWERW
jgi:hypothetical protein